MGRSGIRKRVERERGHTFSPSTFALNIPS
jgi:hypothetical protein